MIPAHVLAYELVQADEYVAVIPHPELDGVRILHFPSRWAPALAEIEHEWAALVVIALAHALPVRLD